MRLNYLLLPIVMTLLSGCNLIHEPSYVLGKKISIDSPSQSMTRDDVLKQYGELVVPCQDTNNICYLYADIKKMKLTECEMVEFAFNEEKELEHIVIRRAKT